MGKLMLLNGFGCKNVSASTLREFLNNHSDGKNIVQFWSDPTFQEIRMVALFEKDIAKKKILQLQRDGLHSRIAVEPITPPCSIFVRATGESWKHGLLDKLNMIFAKEKKKIVKIENLPDSCFEIIFNDGWDSVKRISQETLTFEGCKLEICPYFDCFKMSPQEQYQEIHNKLKMSLSTEVNDPRNIEHISSFSFALPIVPILLNVLNFKEAVKQFHKDLKVKIDVEEAEIQIEGSQDLCKDIEKVLSDVNKKLKLPDSTKDFLELEAVQHEVLSYIHSTGLQISLDKVDDKLSLNVVGNQKKESFQTFISSLVLVKKCHLLPDENIEHNPAWNDFIISIHSKYLFYQVVTEDTSILLLSLIFCDVSETNGIENSIKEFISKCSDPKIPSTIKKNPISPTAIEVTFSFPLNMSKIGCCKKFLQDEVSKIQAQLTETQLNIRSNDIQIICKNVKVLDEVSQRLKTFFESILFIEKELEFPGLNLYLQSEEGRKLILGISEKHRCFIEYPSDNSPSQVPEQSIERFNYRVCMLGTGRRNNCNIHLVQGNTRHMKLQQNVCTQVNFIPSNEAQECSFQLNETVKDVRIYLPPWKSLGTDSAAHFRKLRQTFLASLDELFGHIKRTGSCTVVISTSNVHKAQFSFPLDVIVNSVAHIFKTFTDLHSHPATVDFYICETKHESVFKAFTHALKKQGILLGAPDQSSWDKISLPDMVNCVQYSLLKCKVEVASFSPENPKMKSLYCYPIRPSLEAASCPIYFESKRSKYLLEDSLRNLSSHHPDGLLIGETFCLESTSFYKLLLFCFPEWGADIHKALQDSLTSCIQASSDYDAVYITVPESQHPKFPKQYFVQTFFQSMDDILGKLNVYRQKKIVLLVYDAEYREAFSKELARRYKADSNGQGAAMRDPMKVTNAVQTSCVSFCAKSEDDLKQAHLHLTRELSHLMSKFTTYRRLTEKEALIFEKKISTLREIPVLLTLHKRINEQGQRSEKGMSRNKNEFRLKDKVNPTSFETSLTIQGLSDTIVSDFMSNFSGL